MRTTLPNYGFIWEESLVNDRPLWKCTLYSRRRPVSSALLFPLQSELWLEQIETRARYQGIGYGTALMKYIIASPLQKKRWVRLNILPFGPNAPSHEQLETFYQKLGFRATVSKRYGQQVWELDTWK